MLRRRLFGITYGLCFLVSMASWIHLFESPSFATGCTGGCGPDTKQCQGTDGSCSDETYCGYACTGTYTIYFDNTSCPSASKPNANQTITNVLCTASYKCANVTILNKYCNGIYWSTCSPRANSTCSNCQSSSTGSVWINDCYESSCTEG